MVNKKKTPKPRATGKSGKHGKSSAKNLAVKKSSTKKIKVAPAKPPIKNSSAKTGQDTGKNTRATTFSAAPVSTGTSVSTANQQTNNALKMHGNPRAGRSYAAFKATSQSTGQNTPSVEPSGQTPTPARAYHARPEHGNNHDPRAFNHHNNHNDRGRRHGKQGRHHNNGGHGGRFMSPEVSTTPVSDAPKDTLRVIVLGGNEEVGRNMTVFEYNGDIITVDMGLQFPEEGMHGIDYIVPNTKYLEGKEDHIRGCIITHAHLDHIGAIPHLNRKLRRPKFYMGAFTKALVIKKQEEVGEPLDVEEFDENSHQKMGVFEVEYFRVNHNIPGSFGIVINTPVGRVMHTGDFKIDHSPVGDAPVNIQRIAQMSMSGGIKMLMADSTNAAVAGYQLSESVIGKNLEELIEDAEGRIIIAAFASLLSRAQSIFNIAKKIGRKVITLGRGMELYVGTAYEMGLLDVTKEVYITTEEAKKIPPEKLIILATGGQGEQYAAMTRITNGTDRNFKIIKGDTVIFSSSVIPGNERSVQAVQDTLIRKSAHLIHYKMLDIHAGGHARKEDLKMFNRLVMPEYFMPIEGNHFMLEEHADSARQVGMPDDHVFVADNGQIMEITKDKATLTNMKVPTDYVMVDGLGVGDVSNVVLRDRQMLAEDGIFVVIATTDQHGKLSGSPDIISRGFIYLKENQRLLGEARDVIKKVFAQHGSKVRINESYVRDKIRNDVGQFLYGRTQRRPMVLPVIIKV